MILLHRIADGIEERFADFLEAEIADTGKPVSLASRIDIPPGAANLRVFADLVRVAGVEAFRTETPDGSTALNYAVRKPIGVVGVITQDRRLLRAQGPRQGHSRLRLWQPDPRGLRGI